MTQSLLKPSITATMSLEDALQYSIDMGKQAMAEQAELNKSRGLPALAHLPEVCIEVVEYEGYSGRHQRRIVSAANRFLADSEKPVIIASSRHYDHLMVEHIQRYRELGLDLGHAHGDDQGFIDQFRNYWTREEAWIIALHAGQIRERVSGDGELYSENLY